MDLALQGKVALVGGASRGIGSYIARRLAEEGCDLLLTARNAEPLVAMGETIAKATGVRVESVSADIASRSAASSLAATCRERFGGVDVYVGNAGGNRRKPFVETTDQDWDEIVELNLLGHARLARELIPLMQSRGGGAITFITSIFGREAGGPGLSIYNTTKSALISLAKIMAVELAGDGIRVNSIAPGSIRFPGGSWDRRCVETPEAMEQFVEANIPLGRFGTAEEVADAVAYISSDRAALITGACLNVDGGQSRSLI